MKERGLRINLNVLTTEITEAQKETGNGISRKQKKRQPLMDTDKPEPIYKAESRQIDGVKRFVL